jgi:hypothetical protein
MSSVAVHSTPATQQIGLLERLHMSRAPNIVPLADYSISNTATMIRAEISFKATHSAHTAITYAYVFFAAHGTGLARAENN